MMNRRYIFRPFPLRRRITLCFRTSSNPSSIFLRSKGLTDKSRYSNSFPFNKWLKLCILISFANFINFASVGYYMNGYQMLGAVSGIENSPVPDTELVYTLILSRKRFRSDLIKIFGEPLNFRCNSLGNCGIKRRKIF